MHKFGNIQDKIKKRGSVSYLSLFKYERGERR